ncbi:hypothetical protein PIB30_016237 [Stylosanthes scabra]|uniref:DUF4283 domain-containing protein n=1 Tax=Stylosanthes scabra TaxID=79078 RepID=A0ABU6X8Z5_9FABA|nr:hypothetical protein [Stylosanthes scabra]
MERCLVGDMMKPYDLDELKLAIRNDAIDLEEVKMCGPLKIFLVFASVCEADEALQLESLRSLPIHGWTKENMKRIGRVWGQVVQIEEEEGGHYNYFRVQIIANISPTIRALASVEIGGEIFSIFVNEDEERIKKPMVLKPREVEDDNLMRARIDEIEEPVVGVNGFDTNIINKAIDASDDVNVVAMAEEAEESKVGETQSLLKAGKDDGRNGADNLSQIILGYDNGNELNRSRTPSIQDDRRTEDVIQEWSEEFYQRPNSNVDGLMKVNNSQVGDPEQSVGDDMGSESLSIPPGFENVEISSKVATCPEIEEVGRNSVKVKKGGRKPQKIFLKLNEKVKEKAKRCKEARKQKKLRWRELREVCDDHQCPSTEEEIEDSNLEEEIEDSNLDAEATWDVGIRVGLEDFNKEKAKKYLVTAVSASDEGIELNNQKTAKRSRGRKRRE